MKPEIEQKTVADNIIYVYLTYESISNTLSKYRSLCKMRNTSIQQFLYGIQIIQIASEHHDSTRLVFLLYLNVIKNICKNITDISSELYTQRVRK